MWSEIDNIGLHFKCISILKIEICLSCQHVYVCICVQTHIFSNSCFYATYKNIIIKSFVNRTRWDELFTSMITNQPNKQISFCINLIILEKNVKTRILIFKYSNINVNWISNKILRLSESWIIRADQKRFHTIMKV